MIIIGVALVVVSAALFFVLREDGADTAERPVPEGTEALGGGFVGTYADAAAVITRTAEGYEPRAVTINEGEAVSFTNESEEYHWPASDIHPTHGLYSEFDPRAPVAPGDTWTFIFDEPGEWDFHDHLRANETGTVTVEE